MIQPPASMIPELSAWNNGTGIELESWVGCSGNFKLAAGYAALFWPEFNLFEDYIFLGNPSTATVRGFEAQANGDRRYVEWVINHLHLADLQSCGCADISEDKIMFLGRKLKAMWEAKLLWQFPARPCQVEFYEPEDRKNLVEYQLSFWQKKHAQSR